MASAHTTHIHTRTHGDERFKFVGGLIKKFTENKFS